MNGNGEITFKNTPEEKLINLEWKNPLIKTNIGINNLEQRESRCMLLPNPCSTQCVLYVSGLSKSYATNLKDGFTQTLKLVKI